MRARCHLRFTVEYLPATSCRLLLAAFFLLLVGCGAKDPFRYVQVHGKVTYEDGALIPADPLVLVFYPQDDMRIGKDHARPGMATVDKANGTFDSVTSHLAGDGLVRGRHKVTLTSTNRLPLPPSIVPPEYGDWERTPLEIDTANSPFELKVRKPH